VSTPPFAGLRRVVAANLTDDLRRHIDFDLEDQNVQSRPTQPRAAWMTRLLRDFPETPLQPWESTDYAAAWAFLIATEPRALRSLVLRPGVRALRSEVPPNPTFDGVARNLLFASLLEGASAMGRPEIDRQVVRVLTPSAEARNVARAQLGLAHALRSLPDRDPRRAMGTALLGEIRDNARHEDVVAGTDGGPLQRERRPAPEPMALSEIVVRLDQSSNARQADLYLLQLARSEDPSAIDALAVAAVDGQDETVRAMALHRAAQALGARPADDDTSAPVARRLRDAAAGHIDRVRSGSPLTSTRDAHLVSAAGALRQTAAVPTLLAVAEHVAARPELRAAAVSSLAEIGLVADGPERTKLAGYARYALASSEDECLRQPLVDLLSAVGSTVEDIDVVSRSSQDSQIARRLGRIVARAPEHAALIDEHLTSRLPMALDPLDQLRFLEAAERGADDVHDPSQLAFLGLDEPGAQGLHLGH